MINNYCIPKTIRVKSIIYFLTKLSDLFICDWQIISFYFKLKSVDTFITSKELIIITLVILKLFYFIFFGSFFSISKILKTKFVLVPLFEAHIHNMSEA